MAKRRIAALAPAVERWQQQYGGGRPLEARAADNLALHDRLILVDEATGYSLTQSFKDLAKRSPATLLPLHSEIARSKVEFYGSLWEASPPVP